MKDSWNHIWSFLPALLYLEVRSNSPSNIKLAAPGAVVWSSNIIIVLELLKHSFQPWVCDGWKSASFSDVVHVGTAKQAPRSLSSQGGGRWGKAKWGQMEGQTEHRFLLMKQSSLITLNMSQVLCLFPYQISEYILPQNTFTDPWIWLFFSYIYSFQNRLFIFLFENAWACLYRGVCMTSMKTCVHAHCAEVHGGPTLSLSTCSFKAGHLSEPKG